MADQLILKNIYESTDTEFTNQAALTGQDSSASFDIGTEGFPSDSNNTENIQELFRNILNPSIENNSLVLTLDDSDDIDSSDDLQDFKQFKVESFVDLGTGPRAQSTEKPFMIFFTEKGSAEHSSNYTEVRLPELGSQTSESDQDFEIDSDIKLDNTSSHQNITTARLVASKEKNITR